MSESSTPRLLLVISTLPVWPDTDGFTLRVHGLLGSLAHDWRIVLICEGAVDDVPDMPYLERITVVQAGRNYTFLPNSFDPALFVAAVHEQLAVERPAVVLLWGPIEAALGAIPGLPPLVVDRVDCLTLMAYRNIPSPRRNPRAFVSALRTTAAWARYERTLSRHCGAATVVGDDDARVLRRLASGLPVHVVPNGVQATDACLPRSEMDQPTVIFTGTLDFHPNVDAAVFLVKEIWPKVRATLPRARLRIVGRRPVEAVLALGACDGVEIVPDVPDMKVELRAAWVAVAPMRRGAGLKNKVLEAWAAALPVVMTPIALNGLPNATIATGFVHEDPAQFARTVIRLLSDEEFRMEVGSMVRRSVEEHATWRVMGGRLDRVLRSVADEG